MKFSGGVTIPVAANINGLIHNFVILEVFNIGVITEIRCFFK